MIKMDFIDRAELFHNIMDEKLRIYLNRKAAESKEVVTIEYYEQDNRKQLDDGHARRRRKVSSGEFICFVWHNF